MASILDINWPSITEKTLAIIMGGGAGTRLFPLTKERSKPAVPLGGKYRIVDIPISNCLNSGLRRIYVLTQFNSVSLHRHIHGAYKFDHFSRSFVEILAAQQTPTDAHWYQGTADAVRQNLADFLSGPYEYFIILSGDQLYRMDYRLMLDVHIKTKADITIGTIPVSRADASGFGIMQTDDDRRIVRFVEKPKDPAVLESLRIPVPVLKTLGQPETADLFQASMGIYIFNRAALTKALDNQHMDFGKHVIPEALDNFRVQAYVFQGYWEDIGTIRAFFDANLLLTNPLPPFSFFDASAPIFTHARFLPGSKVNGASVRQAIISDGCIISDATIERAVLGIRTIIRAGSTIKNSVVMGADYYQESSPGRPGDPPIGIGEKCVVDHAIVDKNARIGGGCVLTPDGKDSNCDGPAVLWKDGQSKPLWYVRDGIVVIPKGAVIPDGTWV